MSAGTHPITMMVQAGPSRAGLGQPLALPCAPLHLPLLHTSCPLPLLMAGSQGWSLPCPLFSCPAAGPRGGKVFCGSTEEGAAYGPLMSPLLISLTSVILQRINSDLESLCSIINWAGRLPINKIKLSPVRWVFYESWPQCCRQWGWGRGGRCLLWNPPVLFRGLSSCHEQAPGTWAPPGPPLPWHQSEQPLLGPQAGHWKVTMKTPCVPRHVWVCHSLRGGPLGAWPEPEWGQGLQRQLDLPRNAGGRGTGGGSAAGGSSGPCPRGVVAWPSSACRCRHIPTRVPRD